MLKILDNSGKEYRAHKDGGAVYIDKNDIAPGTEYINIELGDFKAKAGDDGYFVVADAGGMVSRLCKFNDKKDEERVYKQNLMPIFGIKKNGSCILAIVDGLKYEMYIVIGVKDGEYYMYPRFQLDGEVPYENISVRFIELGAECGYSEMAAAYREYQLQRGACRPITEKMKEREVLKYAAFAPEIRIRMGWKPAPPTVLEQTPENEPEMKVACTFDRVCDIIDELKAQGVDKAQLCLVGWNVSGHDGRYPQVFPVEERLGGEERLRHLISYAEKNGYAIVCHTNSTDCYSIADTFSEDIVIKNQDGSLAVNDKPYSGGTMYHLCPKKAVEYAERDLPKIRELGFKGLHYVDVISVVPLRRCFDKNHPSSKKETLECYNKIMKQCHELFGGFSSEGAMDFCAEYLDYGFYVAWMPEQDDMFDRQIPLWAMVYHGIILYNPDTTTVNYPIKDADKRLRVLEYGGRPSFYFYSKYGNGGDNDDWLGKEDLICDTDEQLKYSVSKIKEAYDEYKEYAYLQTEFIEKHEEIEPGVFEITYSNGDTVRADYNRKTFSLKK